MDAKDLPLFELFTRLQEADLPLGLNEYAQVVKALQAGFGVADKAALARLCQSLWVKTETEAQIFNYHFAEVFTNDVQLKPDKSSTRVRPSSFGQPIGTAISQPIQQTTTHRIINGVLIGITLLTVGITGFQWYQTIESQSAEENINDETEDSDDDDNEVPLAVTVGSSATAMVLGGGICWLVINRVAAPLDDNNSSDGSTQTENVIRTISKPAAGGQQAQAKLALTEAAQAAPYQANISSISTTTKADYLPITKRKLKQSWRYLRSTRREGPKTELDIEGTVQQISRHGFFVEPVKQAARRNRTDLILLLDQDGSMVPFQSMGRQLIQTAARAGHLPFSNIYYFHNCPTQHLYHDRFTREPEPISRFLTQRLSSTSVVMIFSDGGAARGNLNPSRVQKTETFLNLLTKYARRVVWLNPLPADRWSGTSADPISKLVAMFETNPKAFKLAIDVLRGQKLPDNLSRRN